jgi:hypothetical protein
MNIKDFKPANITWILNNIKCNPKFKYFQLDAVLPIGKDFKEFNARVDIYRFKLSSRRIEESLNVYMLIRRVPKFVGFGCWNAHMSKLIHEIYQQTMGDVGMLRCLAYSKDYNGV